MRRSEIFDNFVKIAQDKGLVSEDAPEKAKKKLESNPRADSLDIKAIEALYGVKNDTEKSMEYKHNIMEDAHPESVIISPSYDKLNGLVENNIERQNIILNIVNKTPNGQLTQHKYAKQELLLSLVRLGNDLDNKNNDELRVLADTCLAQASEDEKKLVKNAIGPVAIIGIAALAVGAIWAWQHLPNISRGFQRDSERLKKGINDLLNSESSWGFGIKIKEEEKESLRELLATVEKFDSIYNRLYPIIISVQKPQKGQPASGLQDKVNQATQARQILQNNLNKLVPYINQFKENYSDSDYKDMVTSETGVVTEVAEDTHLYGGKISLFADKFETIATEIPAYLASISAVLGGLNKAQTIAANAKAHMSEQYSSGNTGTPSARVKAPSFEEGNDSGADQEIASQDKDIVKMLGGG
jgi:hypothetical protein